MNTKSNQSSCVIQRGFSLLTPIGSELFQSLCKVCFFFFDSHRLVQENIFSLSSRACKALSYPVPLFLVYKNFSSFFRLFSPRNAVYNRLTKNFNLHFDILCGLISINALNSYLSNLKTLYKFLFQRFLFCSNPSFTACMQPSCLMNCPLTRHCTSQLHYFYLGCFFF